jgi:transposase
MDRALLEEYLRQGLSLAEIGRRVGRHEATVGYWMRKHELTAVNQRRHCARGGLRKERLQTLVDRGMSIAQIATEVQRSKATVRYWLQRYALPTHGTLGRRTQQDRAAAREADREIVLLHCRYHGEVEFWLNGRGYYRCKLCRSAAVTRRRRRMKKILVDEAGGACSVCGYARSVRALHFHHPDPTEKRHEINARGAAMALEQLRAEAVKCVLLCANCHAEVEAGIITLPAVDAPHLQSVGDPTSPPG